MWYAMCLIYIVVWLEHICKWHFGFQKYWVYLISVPNSFKILNEGDELAPIEYIFNYQKYIDLLINILNSFTIIARNHVWKNYYCQSTRLSNYCHEFKGELKVVIEWATFVWLEMIFCFMVSDLRFLLNFDSQFIWILFSSHIPMARWNLACNQVVISSSVLCMVFFVLKHKHHCDMPWIFICSHTCHTCWTLSCTTPQILHGGNLIFCVTSG